MADQNLPTENNQPQTPSTPPDTGLNVPPVTASTRPAKPASVDPATPATPKVPQGTSPGTNTPGADDSPQVSQPVTPPVAPSQVQSGSNATVPTNDTTQTNDVSNMAKPVQPPAAPVGTDDNLMAQEGVQKSKINDIKESVFSAQTDKPQDAPKEPEVEEKVEQTPKVELAEPEKTEEVKEEAMSEQVPPVQQVAAAPAPQSDAQDPMLAKTHEPVIIMPDRLEMGQVVSIKVKVGMIGHVMEDDHFIQSIELQAADKSVGKVDLNPKQNSVAEADFKVPLNAGMQIKAVSNCNKHGRWESVMSV